MRITIQCPEIPSYLRASMSMPKAAAEFLEYAAREGTIPAATVTNARPLMITIPQETFDALVATDRTGAPLRLGAYIQSVIDKRQEATPRPALAERSVYQQRFFDGIADSMGKGKIVIAEGATGIGKGRVIARLAMGHSQSGNGPVAIAAPTVTVLRQLIREWDKADYPLGPVSCVLGKQQFVDTEALVELITADDSPVRTSLSAEKVNGILSWVDQGCPPLKENPETAPIAKIAPTVSCLDADLLMLAPEMEPFGHLYQLSDQSDTEGISHQAYVGLRDSARDADIIYCTHAMIAYDCLTQVKNKTRLLPEYRTILIDEGHLFERNVSNVHTHNVSILSLRALLHSSSVGSKANRNRCARICSEMMAISAQMDTSSSDGFSTSRIYRARDFENGTTLQNHQEAEFFSQVGKLKDGLEALLGKKKGDVRLSYYLYALQQITRCIKGVGSYPIMLTNTPIRKYPVLSTGKPSVAKDLERIWNQVRSAAIISATLSVPSGQNAAAGAANYEYIISKMAIPPHRIACPLPVIPEWVTHTPTLHTTGPSGTEICPPNYDEFQGNEKGLLVAQAEWRKQIGREILAIAGTAKGGTLVLACSYDDVNGFGAEIKKEMGDRLLLKKSQSVSMEQQKRLFIEMSRAGRRPVWIAVGGAWTGLDLNDHNVSDETPEKDLLLTDLVVPRINFSDNQTFSGMLKKRKTFNSTSFTAAAFTLRQGFGRLIRRPGVKHRRLWFLDGRAATKGSNYNVFRNIMATYPKKAPIAPAK